MALEDTRMDALRLNLPNVRGDQTAVLRAFGLGRAESAMAADMEGLRRDLQRQLQASQLTSTERIAGAGRESSERLAGLQLDFGREQLEQRESEFSRTFGFEEEKAERFFGLEKERFGEFKSQFQKRIGLEEEKFGEFKSQFEETFGLEEDKFKEFQSQFEGQMDFRLRELRQQGELGEGRLALGREEISARETGEDLTAEDFSSLLDQLMGGRMEELELRQEGVQNLLGGGFNPAPEGAAEPVFDPSSYQSMAGVLEEMNAASGEERTSSRVRRFTNEGEIF